MIRYEVIAEFSVKTPDGVAVLKPGQVIKLPEQSAKPLVEAGKIKPLPYITNYGSLVIPFDSPQEYHWWNRGQSVLKTLEELKADNEIVQKYKYYRN